MNKKKLLTVILTWNDFDNTSKCLESCKKSQSENTTFLLVDNNSTDGSLEKIIDKFKLKDVSNKIFDQNSDKFIFIKNSINLGCGFGHNTGYDFAIKNKFKYVARIDNDMQFGSDFFNENLKILDENPKIEGLSPKIMYQNKKNKIWWMGCKISNNLKFQTHMRDYPYNLDDNENFKNLKETDAIAGCASIMRVKRLEKVGLSDKDFFYGPEDIEFSRRIYSGTNSLMVNLNSKIFHAVTQSFKAKHSFRRKYFEHKYRLLLIKKIGTKSDKIFGYSISIFKFFLYCLFSFKKKHRQKIRPVFKSLCDFFIFNRLGEYDRIKNNQ